MSTRVCLQGREQWGSENGDGKRGTLWVERNTAACALTMDVPHERSPPHWLCMPLINSVGRLAYVGTSGDEMSQDLGVAGDGCQVYCPLAKLVGKVHVTPFA